MHSKSPAVPGTGTTERENFCPTPCVALEDEVDLRRAAVTTALLLKTAVTPEMMVEPVQAADLGGQVNILVYDYASLPDSVLVRSRRVVERILRKTAIDLSWIQCRPTQRVETCDAALKRGAVIVKILPKSKQGRLRRGADKFGAALPARSGISNSTAYVFYEAIARLGSSRISTGRLLGHVITHEVGHLLLGPNSHSRSGIMQLHWDDDALQLAATGTLLFTRRQSRRMRTRLTRRSPVQATVVQRK